MNSTAAGRSCLPPADARNMRDLGSPSHSKRFFRCTMEKFGALVRLFVVRSRATPVAASLTLTDRRTIHVPWAASDWRARQSCPNMLLYWSMLANALDRKAEYFNFDRSTRDSGTYRFKKQWGATEAPLYWHYLARSPQVQPALRPDSPRYRWLVRCWRRLPVGVARVLGPRIIGKLA